MVYVGGVLRKLEVRVEGALLDAVVAALVCVTSELLLLGSNTVTTHFPYS